MKLFKNIRFYGWAVLPQTRPSSFHSVEEPFCLNVMHTFKTIQVYGWAALPNNPCHGPAHFAALKYFFVVMLCRLSTTFDWTVGRAPPNTVQLNSRCWSICSSGSYEAFQIPSNFRLGLLFSARPSASHGVKDPFRLDNLQPFKTIQVYGWAALPNIPCHDPAHFAALSNFFVVMLCRLSTTFKSTAGRAPPNTIEFISRS